MTTAPEDDGVPNVARIHDYFLGGSHNFAVDRERAEAISAAQPGIAVHARANRSFLRHVVEHAIGLGITQFLDLGSGIPTVGNVHEVAHRLCPSARVAYVDNERVAVAHSAAILRDVDGATITDADLREPEQVLAAPGVAGLLDVDRPSAVLVLAAVHFLPDDRHAQDVLGAYRRALAPGSTLAMTHGSDDYPEDPAFVAAQREAMAAYASTSNPVRLRSREQIRALLASAELVPDADGLVELRRWATPPQDEPIGGYAVISEPSG